jgi:hypothetical protein
LIAEHHTHEPALALSKGLDRDRAVDESGNQVSVFNRVGSRPLTLPEMRRLYVRGGEIYTVEDSGNPPPTPPLQKEGRHRPPQSSEAGFQVGAGASRCRPETDGRVAETTIATVREERCASPTGPTVSIPKGPDFEGQNRKAPAPAKSERRGS